MYLIIGDNLVIIIIILFAKKEWMNERMMN
jgi:hypothetical protein